MPIREEIARMRYTEEENLSKLDVLEEKIKEELSKLTAAGGEEDVA